MHLLAKIVLYLSKCTEKRLKQRVMFEFMNSWTCENFLASYPFPPSQTKSNLNECEVQETSTNTLTLIICGANLGSWMTAPSTLWTHSSRQFEQTHRHSNTTKCWHMTKTMTTNVAKGQNNFSVSHYKLISILAYFMMISLLRKSYSVDCWDDSEWL